MAIRKLKDNESDIRKELIWKLEGNGRCLRDQKVDRV
jgi:hypothetical protein